MSTPEDSGVAGPSPLPAGSPEPLQSTIDPNNPPWGFLQALLTWFISVGLIVIVPQLVALPYVATHYRGIVVTQEMLLKDKTYIFWVVAGILPAHLITLFLCWAVASRFGKISVTKSLGLSWPRNFGIWKSTGLAILLLAVAIGVLYKFGGQDTDLERILRSSRAAAMLMAIVAAATAPLVEEVIYRGLLYSALHRLAGPVLGVVIVTSMFAGLHVFQYWPNFAAISVISLLSLVLTLVRARTGRLLPCYMIHLVFNGIQSVIIVVDPFRQEAVTSFVSSLVTVF